MGTREDLHKAEKDVYQSDANMRYCIARLGDELAKREGYKGLEGMDAITRFLCDKHHWFPHQVRRLSTDDLGLLLDGDLDPLK